MGRGRRDDQPEYGDEFEAEPDDRPAVSWDDPDDDRDVELLDDIWQRDGGGRRPRWLLLLLVIPVVALVVFQIKPDTPPSGSPTPSTSSPAPSRASGESSPPVSADDVGPPRSWRQGAAAKPVVRNLGHPLLGVPSGSHDWELFVYGEGSVTRVEPGRGRVTMTKVPGLGQDAAVNFIVTSAGAFGIDQNGGDGFAVLDGAKATHPPTTLTAGGLNTVLPGPDPDHVWALSYGQVGERAVLLDSHLRRTGTVRSFPANQSPVRTVNGQSDGAGTLVATTPGGTYTVGRDGLRRITSGKVVGAGPTAWLVVECNDTNRCRHVVIDRRTGSRRQIQTDLPLEGAPFEPYGAISPNGTTMASTSYLGPRGPTVLLTNLLTGQRRTVGHLYTNNAAGTVSGMAWSPDSRWLFFVADTGEVTAVDPSTGRSTVLHLGVDRPREVAVRTVR